MSLVLLTLNIEADRHLERVRAAILRYAPHVVCLQEVLERDCPRLAALEGYRLKYAPTTWLPATGDAELCHWGVAVLTRVPVRGQSLICYAEDPRLRAFERPNDPRRTLLVSELEHAGERHRIVTTHFTWSPDGQASDEQRADFVRLKAALSAFPDYVLCGDFNAPRGREMFGRFVQELGLVDHLPKDVRTTLDPRFHYASGLELVVDTVFSTPHYRVADVQVLEGISDHKGILATLARSAPQGRP